MDLLLVGVGGFVGAISRFAISKLIKYLNFHPLVSTLTVNVVGCFLITFLFGLIFTKADFNTRLSLFVMVGFLGSFTTFATFSIETVLMFNKGFYYLGVANVALQFVLCFAAATAGAKISGVI